jgi:phosphopantothenoylcysteine decarboxylase / phosphopantothenate---cysteine ligase
LSGRPVFTDQWDARVDNNMAHIDLGREADAVLVAPASADCLAKLAHGLADDLLTTLILARDCPLLVAPAMNRQMWENPATQRNAAQLATDGITVLGPAEGEQACGETGAGRMLEPDAIVEALVAFFVPKRLAGRKLVLTAGPTFEAIDPVRGITNLSSGKMGYAIARAAQHAGAEVVLVSGPVSLNVPSGVRAVQVQSARQMYQAVMAEIAKADVFVGVAAVADYGIANTAEQKLKKDGSGQPPTIELVLNPDILAEVAALPAAPLCVGFAAESENLHAYAEAKRLRKKIPLIVGNQIQDGFGGDTNTVVLFDEHGAHSLPTASKDTLAGLLVEHIAGML